MARRPYFSGNYGSALGSTANAANLIAQAGATQGQMYANIGNQIGGMIKQYGLNKEKQKENKSTIKSSIGILQRMSKIDEANAPEYMAQIEQLGNEDIPLSERGMLADKTLKGISITNQYQGQMLINQGKQQALGLAKQLEASKIENAKLQNTNLGIKNDLAGLLKRKGEALTDAEITSFLNKHDQNQKLLPSETDAKIAANKASQLKSDTDSASILGQGGPAGAAKQRAEDNDLSREDKQSQIDYRKNVGLAQIYKTLREKNPTFAEQFNPLAGLQDKLRGLTVKTPKGESVSFAEYEELHNKEPELYPMNNEPGAIRGQIESVNLQIYNLSREQPVQVDVPDEINEQSEQAPPPVPAYQKALDDIGERKQREYMNQPEIGGMGFPFMP